MGHQTWGIHHQKLGNSSLEDGETLGFSQQTIMVNQWGQWKLDHQTNMCLFRSSTIAVAPQR